jgi:MHS family proline/betaine transporter-like MFS transporter
MRPLGGIIIGRFGDTHGRKAALTLTIMTMALGTASRHPRCWWWPG